MPIRVLHVVRSLRHGGGVQCWLMECLQRIDRRRIEFDFITMDNQVDYRDQIIRSGSHVHRCSGHHNVLTYKRKLYQAMQSSYDIVHTHCEHYDGVILEQAHRRGVPIRISHAHTEVSYLFRIAGKARQLWLKYLTNKIRKHATHGFAVSRIAGQSFFRDTWEKSDAFRLVLPCGIDLTPFRRPIAPDELRQQLDIHKDCLVIGNVGRFDLQKNHQFMIAIASQVIRREGNVRFLFVGSGDLEADIRRRVREAEIGTRVLFLGVREDVPDLLRGVIDVFLFPSHYEGLGLALIEAQAAGTPSVISDVIPEEAVVIPTLCRRLSLQLRPEVWAEAILENNHILKQYSAERAVNQISKSAFNIDTSARRLLEAYHKILDTTEEAHPCPANESQ